MCLYILLFVSLSVPFNFYASLIFVLAFLVHMHGQFATYFIHLQESLDDGRLACLLQRGFLQNDCDSAPLRHRTDSILPRCGRELIRISQALNTQNLGQFVCNMTYIYLCC